MSILEFEKLEDVMSGKIIVVPDYQRDYSWGNTEVATLMDDLANLYGRNTGPASSNQEKHFMGSIVLIPFDEVISKGGKELSSNPKLGTKYKIVNIIDGQQRFSTLSLLLISIRDYAEENGIELEEIQSVLNLLDTGKKTADGERIPVFHFSQENTQKCYDSLLYKDAREYDKRKAGARHLLSSKNYFDDRLKELFGSCQSTEEALNDFVEQVLYSLQLVEIDCGQDSDAFQIFESLNSTGVPLTPAEQVKNLVLMRSNKKDETLNLWEKIVENVGEDDFVEFLAQFLFCLRGHRVSRKDIYREFREWLNSSKVSDVLKQMLQYARAYNGLRNPPAGIPASGALKDLKDLSQKQVYVPLMVAANRFDIESKDFAVVSDAVLVFIVRHQVCSQSSNKLDAVFSKAIEVINNEANGPKEVVAFFRLEQMDDFTFKHMFENLSFPYSGAAQSKARVYLKRLEEKSKGADSPLQLQTVNLSVEHIIPKQPSIEQLEGWIGKEKADALRSTDPKLDDFSEQIIMSIGNLALLYVPENSAANNKSYREKIRRYQEPVRDKDGNDRGVPSQVFSLIGELVDENAKTFNAESVEKRAKKLADKAVGVWR